MSSIPGAYDYEAINGLLGSSLRWPLSFAKAIVSSRESIHQRYVVTDNSRSLLHKDGKRIVTDDDDGETRIEPCTRWEEVTTAVKTIASIADAAEQPTEIRLLNKAQPITVGQRRDGGETLNKVMEMLEAPPNGQTPLCRQVKEVIDQVKGMELRLRSMNKVALMIIITDGESTDGSLVELLKPYESLPLKIIVRMVTNERDLNDYWHTVNAQLDMDIKVRAVMGRVPVAVPPPRLMRHVVSPFPPPPARSRLPRSSTTWWTKRPRSPTPTPGSRTRSPSTACASSGC